MTTADNFKAKGIYQGCLEFYDFKNVQQCIRDSPVQINMKLEAPLVFSNGFLFTRHCRIQCDTKAAEDESYSFIPCRMVYLRHFETLEMWELWNLFKE